MSVSYLLVAILIVVIVAAFVLVAIAKPGSGDANDKWPFYARKPLSLPEQVLYFRLCKALPVHIVLAQVGLSRLLGVKKGNDYRAWNNRINRMSADYVVCSKDSTVLAVIELDDVSHVKEQQKIRDAKKDKALKSAGIRILRWSVKELPDDEAIKAAFAASPIAQANLPQTGRVEPTLRK